MQKPIPNTSTLSHTIIRNPAMLWVMRASWFLIIGTHLLLTVLGTIAFYQTVDETGQQFQYFNTNYIQNNIYATYVSVIIVVATLVCTLIASIVYYRASDSWLIWFVSTAIMNGALHCINLPIYVSIFYPQLQWLTFLVDYFAGLFFSLAAWILPDGRFVPRRLRWFVPLVVIWWFMAIPVHVDTGLTSEAYRMFLAVLLTGLIVSVVVSIGVQVYRYRRASAIERQQMKWISLGIGIWLTIFMASHLGSLYLLPLLNNQVRLAAQFLLKPLPAYGSIMLAICILLAITRNRLWDIDIVINRSLVGAVVTVLLLIVFIATVFVLQSLLQAENQLLALGLSAIVPALLFNPTRKQVRQFIDRRVYGFRFDISELRVAQEKPEIHNPGALSGKVLNGYDVLGVLGQGGMGEVYQGMGNGQTVAIKTMLPKIAQDPDMRKRFEREAEAGMRLNHPHIAKVHAHGEIDGTPYLVMDFIEGQDLSDMLKIGGKLDEETTIRMMDDICGALDVAHSQGFIHRDLKPANIMIKPNGQAVLMDFGVTKVTDASTSLTGTGAIGTIDYMAPEQIMTAKTVDKRADIYALGVMLFEMLTGEKPFKGNAAQILFAHLQQPPPDVLDINPAIPDLMAETVQRALSKKPEDRFQSAGEFAQALRG
jgi:tRNA A-37 threonylcarbamoyl transferase component Bud32